MPPFPVRATFQGPSLNGAKAASLQLTTRGEGPLPLRARNRDPRRRGGWIVIDNYGCSSHENRRPRPALALVVDCIQSSAPSCRKREVSSLNRSIRTRSTCIALLYIRRFLSQYLPCKWKDRRHALPIALRLSSRVDMPHASIEVEHNIHS